MPSNSNVLNMMARNNVDIHPAGKHRHTSHDPVYPNNIIKISILSPGLYDVPASSIKHSCVRYLAGIITTLQDRSKIQKTLLIHKQKVMKLILALSLLYIRSISL